MFVKTPTGLKAEGLTAHTRVIYEWDGVSVPSRPPAPFVEWRCTVDPAAHMLPADTWVSDPHANVAAEIDGLRSDVAGVTAANGATALYLGGAPSGTDDTAMIEAAISDGKRLPPGTFYYKGNGWSGSAPTLLGSGPESTTIVIAAGKYLIDTTSAFQACRVEGVRTQGGAGVVRGRFTGVDTTGQKVIADCVFEGFTVAAISHNAADSPFWKVERCTFDAANSTSTMCVALSGLCDSSTIRGNVFKRSRVAVKLGAGCANITVGPDNDFIGYDAGTTADPGRVGVWIVPKANRTDAAVGVTVTGNKFGNENIAVGDKRVLLADEAAGAFFAERLPATTPSTGYVVGVKVTGGIVNGGATSPPIVTSYTPNVIGCRIERIHCAGTPPEAVLKLAPGVSPRVTTGTVVGPLTVDVPGAQKVPATSPAMNVAVVDDSGVVTGAAALPAGFPPQLPRVNLADVAAVTMSHNANTLTHPPSDGTVFELTTSAEVASGALANAGYFSHGGGFVPADWNGNPVVAPRQNTGSVGYAPYCVRFVTDSPWVMFRGHAAAQGSFSGRVFIKVDGVPIWSEPRVLSTDTFVGWMGGVQIEFRSSRLRLVEIFINWPAFAVNRAVGSILAAAPDTSRKRVAILGDSWIGGTPQGGAWETLSQRVQMLEAYDTAVNGQGGTGYATGTADAWKCTFGDSRRLTALLSNAPHFLVVLGSINDADKSAASVGTACSTLLTDVATRSPSTKVILVGPQLWDSGNPANMAALRAAADSHSNVVAVVDPQAAGWDLPKTRGEAGGTYTDQLHPTPLGVAWWAEQVGRVIRYQDLLT